MFWMGNIFLMFLFGLFLGLPSHLGGTSDDEESRKHRGGSCCFLGDWLYMCMDTRSTYPRLSVQNWAKIAKWKRAVSNSEQHHLMRNAVQRRVRMWRVTPFMPRSRNCWQLGILDGVSDCSFPSISWHFISFLFISLMLCHLMSCDLISFHVIVCHSVISPHLSSCHFSSCHWIYYICFVSFLVIRCVSCGFNWFCPCRFSLCHFTWTISLFVFIYLISFCLFKLICHVMHVVWQ